MKAMTSSLLLVFHFSMAVVSVAGHGIALNYWYTNGQLRLTCKQRGWRIGDTIEWYQGFEPVLRTYRTEDGPVIEVLDNGMDLINRTSVSQLSKYKHSIIVETDGHNSDMMSWECCGGYWCFVWCFEQCSDVISVRETTGTTTVDGTATPPTTTWETDVHIPYNGTLTLREYSSMDTVSVKQLMTLSCTINRILDKKDWIVFWTQNNTPFLITSENSSIINPDDLTYWLPSIFNETGNNSVVIQSLDPQNLNVSSNASQQNITFQVPPALIGESSWKCGNLFIRSFSKEVVINVIPQSTSSSAGTSETSVTTTPFVTSQQMDPDTKDPRPVGTADKQDGESSTTTIIAGSVTGAVVVIVVVVVILALLWRRRNKNQGEKGNYTGNTDTFKEDIVMEENVLYAGRKDKSDYDDERVVQDNILYVGTKDTNEELNDEEKEAVVMEDNVLYEKGNGVSISENGQINHYK